jgi:predicted Zn-dependent protease
MDRTRGRDSRSSRLTPVWGAIGVAVVALGLLGWVGGTAALWSFVYYRQGYTEVRLLDIAFLPFRWDHYQRGRGDHYIARGRIALQENRRQDALFLLRVGVSKSPGNLDGRRQLAELLGQLGAANAGLRVLDDGLTAAADDPSFIRTYVSLLLNAQRDDRLRELADAALAQGTTPPETLQIYLITAAQACYLRDDFAAANRYLDHLPRRPILERHLLEVRMDWDRGARDRAIARLRAIVRELPREEAPQAMLFDFLRAAGRHEEAVEAAALRSLSCPKSIGAQIGLLAVLREREDRSRYERELERISREFAGQSGFAEGLGNLAVQTGDVALAERVAEAAREQKLGADFASMVMLNTRLVAKDYDQTIAAVQELESSQPANAPGIAAWRSGFLAVAHFGRGENDLGELHLARLLGETRLRSDILLSFGGLLQHAGAMDAARRVFAAIVAQDSLQQPALVRLIDLELQANRLDDLPRHLRALLELRKPPVELLQRAHDTLGSDRLLFAPDRTTLLRELRVAIDTRLALATPSLR